MFDQMPMSEIETEAKPNWLERRGQWLVRNRAAFAGLVFGAVFTLVLGAIGQVAFTGKGLSDVSAPPPVIYPGL